MKALWNNQVIAESDKTVFLEGNHYFPPDSVAAGRLTDGTKQYTCPWKGEAKYWNIVIDGEINENSAWSYPDPKPAAREIANHVAFATAQGILIEK